MTAKTPILLLLAGLLLGAAPVALAGQAPVPARKPAPPGTAQEQPKAADQHTAALEPGGDWRVGPVNGPNGGFAYCVAENRFVSGHALLIARSPSGELNLAMGIPGARLPVEERWPVTVVVDDGPGREGVAVAMRPDMLVVPQGRDEDLYAQLRRGRQLSIRSSGDRVAFQLKGTGKALADLKACVDKGQPASASAEDLPEALREILAAAGLRGVQPVRLADAPEEERPADFAWRLGGVYGGVRERTVGEGATLEDLTDEYVAALKAKCPGTTAATLDPVEALPSVRLRTATVDCRGERESVHVALTFYLTDSRLFTALFHEVADADRTVADTARDNVTAVLRRLAGAPKQP